MADEDDQPPAKRIRYNYEDTIAVVVGEGDAERTFTVHKDTDGVVRLKDQDPECFELYVHWVYTRNVDMKILSEQPPDAPGIRTITPSYAVLGKAWGLGNYLQDRHLRNIVIDELIKRANKGSAVVCSIALQQIWDITPPGSAFRRILIQIMICRANAVTFEKHADGWPREVLKEAARLCFLDEAQHVKSVPTWEQHCEYHEHEAGEPKCS